MYLIQKIKKTESCKIKFASIVVTYRCNAKCHMCNIWKCPSDNKVEITPGDIEKLPFIPTVNITGGEPFLRDDICEIISVLKPKTKRVVVSTNGFLTDRILKAAKNHPWIGIRISLEGLPSANDELRGIKDGFDHGIRTLVELNNIGLKDIGFGITISDRNADDVIELYHLAKMMKVEFATAAVHNSYYFHKHDNTFEKPQAAIDNLLKLIEELLKSKRPKDWFRAYFNYGLINYIKGNGRLLPCKMGYDSFFLDPYGEIRPCNVMEKSMGNIKEKTYEEIWNSPEASKIRTSVANCSCNCWMMGSVAEAIKNNLPVTLGRVLKNKFLSRK